MLSFAEMDIVSDAKKRYRWVKESLPALNETQKEALSRVLRAASLYTEHQGQQETMSYFTGCREVNELLSRAGVLSGTPEHLEPSANNPKVMYRGVLNLKRSFEYIERRRSQRLKEFERLAEQDAMHNIAVIAGLTTQDGFSCNTGHYYVYSLKAVRFLSEHGLLEPDFSVLEVNPSVNEFYPDKTEDIMYTGALSVKKCLTFLRQQNGG